ncbi:IPT/TIG domain-containing protein [Polymorphospora rubra]|uniref:IPT/TIG domain-containing protein n=1 Tax=Polymorphospora rubra TaxID=338584 RepID=A0A810MSZ5_9ACTN|nr:IPT/TIG domain-containing protein [Polymorphospora rubra]BCJ64151.1 hypothetical protein Prubr_11720 [Polymorphospora rubra]
MATTPTDRVTSLARSHLLDIDTATYPAVHYQNAIGMVDLKLIEEPRVEDDETYSDAGAMRETNTGYSWRIEATLAYSTNLAGTAIEALHAFLRAKFKGHRSGRIENNEFGIRFYDETGIDSGHDHEGRCYVKSWTMPGGKGGNRIAIVLQGQGPLVDIPNPAATLTPTVTGLTPATGDDAGGNLVSIYGQHFTLNGQPAVEEVDFGANAADDFIVVSDSLVIATAPAGTAGTVAVRVTTSVGQSADTAADNYVYTA